MSEVCPNQVSQQCIGAEATESKCCERYKVIDLLKRHVSVRQYADTPISEEDKRAILEAAFQASSSCFLQVVSVIEVTDPELRQRIAKDAGNQAHVANAPCFWLFVADFARNHVLVPEQDNGWMEQLLVAATDTAIVAQNAMVALESLGMGGVFIGGLRNGIADVAEALKLPKHTIPLLGLAFGYPSVRNEQKPRLPKSVTVMHNQYQPADPEVLKAYNQQMAEYYRQRTQSTKDTDWATELGNVLKKERRPQVNDYLKEAGFIR